MILIVDDELANRFMLRVILEDAGYTVDDVNGGIAALERCGNDIDAVVLDYKMPDLNGVEVATELRARGWDRPIVLYSAYFAAALEQQVADAALDVQLVDKSNHDGLLAALKQLAVAVH
jgi:CheY-like chemotaxis protein